jgi:predicted small metal-binding protein
MGDAAGVFGAHVDGPPAERRDPGWVIVCDCGYVAHGGDEAALVADARRHAREEHGLELSAEQILRSARAPGDAGAGREQS